MRKSILSKNYLNFKKYKIFFNTKNYFIFSLFFQSQRSLTDNLTRFKEKNNPQKQNSYSIN